MQFSQQLLKLRSAEQKAKRRHYAGQVGYHLVALQGALADFRMKDAALHSRRLKEYQRLLELEG